MGNYTISKSVKPGSLVVLSGNKFILASKRNKQIAGVWQAEIRQKMMTLDGKLVDIYVQRGIVRQGIVLARMAEE